MQIEDIENELRNAVKKIEETGVAYADAYALSVLLQEQRKVVLASCFNNIKEQMSDLKRENLARTAPEYQTHLDAMKEAIGDSLRKRAIYERYRAQYETLRSMLSTRKATITGEMFHQTPEGK